MFQKANDGKKLVLLETRRGMEDFLLEVPHHMTLRRYMQFMDELPMLVAAPRVNSAFPMKISLKANRTNT